jgi:predicted ATPase
MHIDRISLRDYPPIKAFDVLTSSNVVIIAGANGSGKTRLKEAVVNSFRNPQQPQASLTLMATRQEEETAWKTRSIQVTAGQDCPVLREYLSTRTKAQAYIGTVVQIDSDRAVQPVRFESFTLATEDPDDQDVNYSWYLNPFIGRWQELVNKVYKKAANRDQKIAKFVKTDPTKPGSEALAAHPDPFLPYQNMFTQLLPGKTLEPIDPKSPREFHYRIAESQPLAFGTLSSGEQEVVKVAFDLVWKRLTHSVILVDEPELHLHPTLAFRLIEILKGFGGGTNQLFLFTHSSDLISTYYATGNVFIVDSSSHEPNQAHQLSSLTTAHSAVARAAGANLGLFAVGKRLVFVEGREASVDRLVYHKVAQSAFPDSYVMEFPRFSGHYAKPA